MKFIFVITLLFSFQVSAGLGEVPKACLSALDVAVASYKRTYGEVLAAWKVAGFSQKDLDYYIVFYLSRNDWPGGYNSPIKKRIGVGLTDRLKDNLATAQGNASFCKITEVKKYKAAHPEMSSQQVAESDDIRDIYGQAIDYFYARAGINWDLLNDADSIPTAKPKSAR